MPRQKRMFEWCCGPGFIGLGCLATALSFRLAKMGLWGSPVFPKNKSGAVKAPL
jgi:hypothetical protein